ncbi:hypothetical protein ACGF7U_30030 [Micromonospora sp. NPDC047670]|uniref:hypothetical protein n=1 Tax=Micromonospora sp. NPDC047670 TaxID=3364252 RepID=UPI0037118A69
MVAQDAVITVPAELPFEAAALLGCAVLAGAGAVPRTARVAPGDSVAVIGLAPLITDRCDLDSAAAAFDRMARGEGARTVVLP